MDWRPWAEHLNALGYTPARRARLMYQSEELIPEILRIIREKTGRSDWSWKDGLTAEQVTQVSYWTSFPIEYLEHVEGYDAGLALTAMLHPYSAVPKEITSGEERCVAQRVPFWIHLPDAVDRLNDLIIYAFDEVSQVHAARWISRFLRARGLKFDPLTLDETNDLGGHWMNQEQIFVALGDSDLIAPSEQQRRRFESSWRRTSHFSPIIDDHVQTYSYGLRYADNCQEMAFNFLRFLFTPDQFDYLDRPRPQTPLVVRLNNQVIGIIKGSRDGDTSMLALRDVRDTQGQVKIAMGGVYQIPKSLGVPPDTKAAMSVWPVVDVTDLRVRSIGPLLNKHAWSIQCLPLLLTLLPRFRTYEGFLIAAGAFSRLTAEHKEHDLRMRELLRPQKFVRRLANDAFEIPEWTFAQQRLHRYAWPAILKRIDRLRRQVESRIEQNATHRDKT